MEEMQKGTIIKLADGNNYIIFDSVKMRNQEYVFMISEEEKAEQEIIYVLKNVKIDEDTYGLTTASEDEYENVIRLYYDIYNEAGILNKDKTNYTKLLESLSDDTIMRKAKESVYAKRKIVEKNDLKMNEAKKLVEQYKDISGQYKNKADKLAEYNQYLTEKMGTIPKFIRKFFLKIDDTKFLK